MDQPTPPADHAHVARLKDAAYERWITEGAELRRISEIVLSKNASRDWTGEMVRLGDDWVVEVCGRGDQPALWTTVVNGQRGQFHYTQEMAVLELIARRYDDNPNTSPQAAGYAARVLGIPTDPNA